MKKAALFVALIFLGLSLQSQDISGPWNGILKVQGMQLRIVFNVSVTEDGYSSTLDSPDQGAFGIPVTSTSFENGELTIKADDLAMVYTGTLDQHDTISGIFKQAGQSFPLNLSREAPEKEALVRPQEDIEPISYHVEEVSFENKRDSVVLAGTLTLPDVDGTYPAVILISGSGPQNRNEEVFGHKPFLVLADHLTKNGIAVLRFDDRGTAESTGDFASATSRDFAEDVASGLRYLQGRKEINKKKIGLMGHSEGGIIAPMVAANSKGVSFIVLLAGTGIRGDQLLMMQQELLLRVNGIGEDDILLAQEFIRGLYDIIIENEQAETLRSDLAIYFEQSGDKFPDVLKPEGIDPDVMIEAMLDQMTNPWMVYFIKYDPVPALEKVKCPVLALNGEKDLQVPAKVNLESIKRALMKGKSKKVEVKELPGLNHLFQSCETGSISEYGEIEETFSPVALTIISDWISGQVK